MLVAITFASPKVSVIARKQVPRRDGVPGVSELFRNNLVFLDVGLVNDISIIHFYFSVYFFSNIVTGLAISEFNQMYEILG